MCVCNKDYDCEYCAKCVPRFFIPDQGRASAGSAADGYAEKTLSEHLMDSEFLRGLVSVEAVDEYLKSLHVIIKRFEDQLEDGGGGVTDRAFKLSLDHDGNREVRSVKFPKDWDANKPFEEWVDNLNKMTPKETGEFKRRLDEERRHFKLRFELFKKHKLDNKDGA